MTHLEDYPFNILDIANLLRLVVRRELSDSVYVDCPFCQRRKGKLNLNLTKNVWRCNRCGKSGHMFELYAQLRDLSVSEAKLELIDLLAEQGPAPGISMGAVTGSGPRNKASRTPVEQSQRASAEEIDQTLRAMFQMLPLRAEHLEHLRTVRGLTIEQIGYLGLKSTPSYKLRHVIPRRLMEQGLTVAGVPGFFVDKSDKWTVNFTSWTAGILIPVRSVDGLYSGVQIRLDRPIKDDADDAEDEGTKYIWLSTSSKPRGAGSGSPVNLIGDRYARTIYVTEGALKAGIAHCLTKRTFLSIQGANNLNGLKEALYLLHETGTQQIVEALDIDKFSNPAVARGAEKIYLLARSIGMRCLSLTWNPNYKGIDDWQIALRRKSMQAKEEHCTNFKSQFLNGDCDITHVHLFVNAWRESTAQETGLQAYLGLEAQEMAAFRQGPEALRAILEPQRKLQHFRIYQLDFSAGQVIPFAFQKSEALYQSGYQQPPAGMYRLVCDDGLMRPVGQGEQVCLQRIAARYCDELPSGYEGRSVAPADVIELYDGSSRRYFYVEPQGAFSAVRFSPALVKNRPVRWEDAGRRE